MNIIKYTTMKKIIIILFFVLIAFAKNAKAQTSGVPDTLAYLQSIVANKAQYIGQPFSVLKNSLKFNLLFVLPHAMRSKTTILLRGSLLSKNNWGKSF